jgi:hypothetical protein
MRSTAIILFLGLLCSCGSNETKPSAEPPSGAGGRGTTGPTTGSGGATTTGGSTSSSTNSSTTGHGGGGSGGAMPNDVVLRDYPAGCATYGAIYPLLPNEASELAATTLTPASYPVTIDQISYAVAGADADMGAQCDSSFGHRVDLYVVTEAKPPAMPSTEAIQVSSYDVPADASAGGRARQVHVDLTDPITLTTGQRLIVAVEMAANSDKTKSLCVVTCAAVPNQPTGVNWWSNAQAEPYAWADMQADFGFDGLYLLDAHGTQAQ